MSIGYAQQVNVQHDTVGSHQTATLVIADQLQTVINELRGRLAELDLDEARESADLDEAIDAVEAQVRAPVLDPQKVRISLDRLKNLFVGGVAADAVVQSLLQRLTEIASAL